MAVHAQLFERSGPVNAASTSCPRRITSAGGSGRVAAIGRSSTYEASSCARRLPSVCERRPAQPRRLRVAGAGSRRSTRTVVAKAARRSVSPSSRTGTITNWSSVSTERWRAGIEPPNRLDRVADEFNSNRQRFGRREDIEDAASGQNSPWASTGSCGSYPPSASTWTSNSGSMSWPGRTITERASTADGRRKARQQCRGGSHDDSRLTGGHGVQRPCTRRGRPEVREEAAIRIDLKRGKRQHLLFDAGLGQAFER